MRKITYKGSIADDVNFLKKGNSRTIKACGLGIVGFALTGFLPVSVPVTVAAAGFELFHEIVLSDGIPEPVGLIVTVTFFIVFPPFYIGFINAFYRSPADRGNPAAAGLQKR